VLVKEKRMPAMGTISSMTAGTPKLFTKISICV
jgi:hypothetical protein